MSDYSGKALALALILGFMLGLGGGLLIGWVIWPVEYYDVDLFDLRPEHQEDYIVMVSATYALDGDLEMARERLLKLEPTEPGRRVAELAQRYLEEGRREEDVRALIALAQALGFPVKAPP